MSSREGTNPAQLVLTTAPTTTNATPTVATPAAANPNPISGTTANLSVLGADDGGESNLTYTWSIASKPPGAANPSFSVNGTNASKNTVVTFTQAGTYAFLAVISDGHTSTDSSVTVVVDQTVTSIALTPKNTAVGIGGVQQFAAGAIDQFGQPLVTAPTYTWSVLTGAGTISSNGLFTAGTTSGSVTVRAASGNISDTATITVSNSAPSVATPANVSDDPVTGTIANLDVLGADDGGESQLVYTWSVANKPAGSSDPTFSNNGTNASKSTVATFNHEGVYGFLVTISDGALSTTSSVNVTVAATPTTVSVTPATTTLTAGASQNFAAAVSDQFNNSILSPSVTWSVISGGGSFAGNTYTAGPAGSSTVQAKSGTAIGTAIVVVGNALPTAAIIDDPNNVYVSASTLTFSAQANDPDGEDSLLNYEWSVFREGVPVDLGNAEIHSASFSYVPAQDGNYDVRLNVTDSVGGSVTKDDDFAVGSAGATAAVTDDVTVRDANAPVLIDVLANDIAPAGDTLSISGIPQQGTHGTASIVVGSPNKISYVPDTDFAGQDSFTYQIRDRYGATNSGSVNVMVLPGGGSSITAGNLAGTQNYVINEIGRAS
ncbi:MAG: Ig-like domain-containing protein, partial [Tepidisphaeraceae bacterium]